MNILYFDSSKDSWSVPDDNAEKEAMKLLNQDVHTSNELVVEYVRALINEEVLDYNKIEVRFIQNNEVKFLYFNQNADLRDWPGDFLYRHMDVCQRILHSQVDRRKRERERIKNTYQEGMPPNVLNGLKMRFKANPNGQIAAIKYLRTTNPDLDLRTSKEIVDKIWKEEYNAINGNE